MQIVTQNINVDNWRQYVYDHPNGNFFQTPEYYYVLEKSKKINPFAIAIIEEEICGLIVGFIQHNYASFLKHLTKRAIVIGGPLVSDNSKEIINKLLQALVNFVNNKVIYLEIRNIFDQFHNKSQFESNKFKYIPYYNLINELSIDQKELINRIKKNKRRNVTKSINKGVEFLELNNQPEFDEALKLIVQTYKRLRIPLPDVSLFNNIINLLPSEYRKIYAAKYNNKIIACRIELCYKNKIYDWYAGDDKNFKSKYPNDFLIYNILLESNNEFEYFDFFGAGKPGVSYNVRDYKLQFGGKLIEYGRYLLILNKLMYQFGEKLYSLYSLNKHT